MCSVTLGGHSTLDPPLPIPNRTVKRSRADDSVLPHVKVGYRQALKIKALHFLMQGFFIVFMS